MFFANKPACKKTTLRDIFILSKGELFEKAGVNNDGLQVYAD